MLSRKWIALAASVAAFSALSVGLSFAQDEKKETLHEIMEKVGTANSKINRTMQTKVRFAKANNGKDVVEPANQLLELAKKAKPFETALDKAKDVKEPKKKWDEFMDALIKSTEELSKNADAGDYDKAKTAHTAVKNSCSECHKVFNIEDDDF